MAHPLGAPHAGRGHRGRRGLAHRRGAAPRTEKLKVAAIFTVPVEQQWVSRIHQAAEGRNLARRDHLRLVGERRQHRL